MAFQYDQAESIDVVEKDKYIDSGKMGGGFFVLLGSRECCFPDIFPYRDAPISSNISSLWLQFLEEVGRFTTSAERQGNFRIEAARDVSKRSGPTTKVGRFAPSGFALYLFVISIRTEIFTE
ncbi:hypothetical protein HW44_12865 [Nitrosococcus oceani]|nr:hypothetical protein HW44_12865 [Nitrosococcus oceani]